MKIATIVPTAFLEETKDDDYHMTLAHLVGVDQVYTKFFRRMSDEGKYVILDNGAFEGKLHTMKDLLDKAEMIKASEIVLPDVIKNSTDTIMKGFDALRAYGNLCPKDTYNIMGAPQGNNISEWVDCAKTMLKYWEIGCIGIPKNLIFSVGDDARLLAMKHIRGLVEDSNVDIHLLGCWNNPREVHSFWSCYSKVRGVDSSIPYIYARDDVILGEDIRPNDPIDFSDTETSPFRLRNAINRWKGMCHGT